MLDSVGGMSDLVGGMLDSGRDMLDSVGDVGRAERGRVEGESRELDKAVRNGEGERWELSAPLPLLAQEDPYNKE
eukprot:4973671-Pyramimonas_sp.AAC.1